MTPTELFEEIHTYCISNSNADNVKKYSRYFKGGYDAFGLTQEQIFDKVKDILSSKEVNLELILKTSKLLIPTGKYEETSFAVVLLKKFSKQYNPEIFQEISHWFDIGINNWAHTDYISGDVISVFLSRKIVPLDALSDWRTAQNKFKRRAVPVSMIKLLKSPHDLHEMLNLIEPMMLDKEREVHQGLGWFLREAWKIHPVEIEVFLLKWKNLSARLIFQYATEKMTKEEKLKFKREK